MLELCFKFRLCKAIFFLLIWTWIAIIGSFTRNIKLWLFPYVLEYLRRSFFVVLYGLCFVIE